jgi:hypothetical protein
MTELIIVPVNEFEIRIDEIDLEEGIILIKDHEDNIIGSVVPLEDGDYVMHTVYETMYVCYLGELLEKYKNYTFIYTQW